MVVVNVFCVHFGCRLRLVPGHTFNFVISSFDEGLLSEVTFSIEGGIGILAVYDSQLILVLIDPLLHHI